MLNSIVMNQSLRPKQKTLRKTVFMSATASDFSQFLCTEVCFLKLNLRHRWTSKSCPPSLPWHKVCKPPQGVVHRKLSLPDGGHLRCGIWQRLSHFPLSPVTLCLHLHYSADPPHLKKKTFEPLRRREIYIYHSYPRDMMYNAFVNLGIYILWM